MDWIIAPTFDVFHPKYTRQLEESIKYFDFMRCWSLCKMKNLTSASLHLRHNPYVAGKKQLILQRKYRKQNKVMAVLCYKRAYWFHGSVFSVSNVWCSNLALYLEQAIYIETQHIRSHFNWCHNSCFKLIPSSLVPTTLISFCAPCF